MAWAAQFRGIYPQTIQFARFLEGVRQRPHLSRKRFFGRLIFKRVEWIEPAGMVRTSSNADLLYLAYSSSFARKMDRMKVALNSCGKTQV
jgi:hypothetical protein